MCVTVAQALPFGNREKAVLIISEEIENYWNGTKTVQDVMEMIQNRVSLYLNEL